MRSEKQWQKFGSCSQVAAELYGPHLKQESPEAIFRSYHPLERNSQLQ